MEPLQLNFDLDDKEEAKKNLKIVQKSFDELLGVMNEQKSLLQNNIKTIDEAKEEIKRLNKVAMDLGQTIKNIHIVLNSKKELWEGDARMQELLSSISTFVTSSAGIKLGVLNNAE